jgi:pyruvate dehydrogenase (quinone)
MTSRQQLALPPHVTAAQAKGFGLWALRSVLSQHGDELVEVAKTNLREIEFE